MIFPSMTTVSLSYNFLSTLISLLQKLNFTII